MKNYFLMIICLLIAGSATIGASTKYVGGDISLLTKYEQKGAIYYNETNNSYTLFTPFEN